MAPHRRHYRQRPAAPPAPPPGRASTVITKAIAVHLEGVADSARDDTDPAPTLGLEGAIACRRAAAGHAAAAPAKTEVA